MLQRASQARRWQRCIAAGLIAYPLISTTLAFSITGPKTHPSKEVFPFFTWSLFSKVTEVRREYEIKILKVDDQPFDRADAELRRAVLTPFGRSALAQKVLRTVGSALRRNKTGAEEARQAFERRYFGQKDVDYEINWRKYNALERWQDRNAYDQLETVGTYSFRGRQR